MQVVQTEDNRFVRDLHSKALLNTDRVALENHRRRRAIESQQQTTVEETNDNSWINKTAHEQSMQHS